MIRRLLVIASAALGLLVFTSTAGAATLGITTTPSTATTGHCATGEVIGQEASDPTTPYIVPSGGGVITAWQTLTAGDVAGSSLTLVVLAPGGGGYTVVGTDTETIPNPLPAGGTASFTISHPIEVSSGDTFALYSTSADVCYFYNSTAIPAADEVFAALAATAPTVGATETPAASASPYETDLAVTLNTAQDAGVQTSTPGTVSAYSTTVLTSVVTNSGPATGPITFTDEVPTGLQIQSAITPSGTCAASGQAVTCTITGLAVGQSATVSVLVTPVKAGNYANAVTVADSVGPDPNTTNNSASAALKVAALPRQCIVPGLRKLPSATAKTLLKELGCKVKTFSQHSSIKKGLVVSVKGGVATYAYLHIVTLVVSSGPKKK